MRQLTRWKLPRSRPRHRVGRYGVEAEGLALLVQAELLCPQFVEAVLRVLVVATVAAG